MWPERRIHLLSFFSSILLLSKCLVVVPIDGQDMAWQGPFESTVPIHGAVPIDNNGPFEDTVPIDDQVSIDGEAFIDDTGPIDDNTGHCWWWRNPILQVSSNLFHVPVVILRVNGIGKLTNYSTLPRRGRRRKGWKWFSTTPICWFTMLSISACSWAMSGELLEIRYNL